MDHKRNFILLHLYIFMTCFSGGAAQGNMMIGIWYKNFTNHQGALADGTCCDNPGLREPNCLANQCDTQFLHCGTYVGGKHCEAYPDSVTGIMADIDSFVLQTQIGNTNSGGKSQSQMPIRQPFSPDNIEFSIEALEVTGNSRVLMANFKFVIDWMDTFFSNDLHWRQLILKDAYCELGIDVLHQCFYRYFGPTCSVYCKPTQQYTCLNDGSKNCTAGWQGPDCDQLVPYCTSGLCQHGGSCTNIHMGYVCSCLPDFWGPHCEYDITGLQIQPPLVPSRSTAAAAPTVSTNLTSASKQSSRDQDVNTIVAATVSVGLILLGSVLSVTIYFLKRGKRKLQRVASSTPSPQH